MKIEAEVKIKILDGIEKGKTYNFTTKTKTDTLHTRYGIIEILRLEWRHIQEKEGTNNDC